MRALFVSALSVLLLAACPSLAVSGEAGASPGPAPAGMTWADEDRVTRENYDRIVLGMTQAEVEDVLGPPDSADPPGDLVVLQWRAGPKWITVGLLYGSVAKKSQSGLD